MATALTIVEAANTGVILWSVAGPLIQQILASGGDGQTEVTLADLDAASIDLGHDLDALEAAIEEKKKRDATAG